MALEVTYDEVQDSELTSDLFGIISGARTGSIRGLAQFAAELSITPATALIEARDSILPAYMSTYPSDAGPAVLLRKKVKGVSQDEARFRLEYERPILTTISGANELQIMRSSGSWEMVQRIKHPASGSGEDFYRVGFDSHPGEPFGSELDAFRTFIKVRLARATQRCPIEILILGGLYNDPPESMRAGFGCVNNAEFLGRPAGFWLCEDVDINKEQLFSNRIHVRVVLASRKTEDWSQWIAPADPDGFNADPRLDNIGDEYQYNVRPVDQANRDVDGILRIGHFPVADFTSLFGAPEW